MGQAQSTDPCPVPVKRELTQPWRDSPPFNQAYLMKLKKEIQEYSPPAGMNVSQPRILMIGPVGAGKSSFVNTITSIFQDCVTRQSLAGSAIGSITMTYRQFQVRSRNSEQPLKFRLCDTCGIEEDEGPDLVDLTFLVEGHVPDGYKFDRKSPINKEIRGFKSEPEFHDKIHCVIFVFAADQVKITPNSIWNKVNQLQRRLYDIPRFAILTKIDELWEELQSDVSKMFVSKDVKDAVDLVSGKLSIPRGDVLPIKNYENETCLDDKKSILALQALDRMLSDPKSYLYSQKDLMESQSKQI